MPVACYLTQEKSDMRGEEMKWLKENAVIVGIGISLVFLMLKVLVTKNDNVNKGQETVSRQNDILSGKGPQNLVDQSVPKVIGKRIRFLSLHKGDFFFTESDIYGAGVRSWLIGKADVSEWWNAKDNQNPWQICMKIDGKSSFYSKINPDTRIVVVGSKGCDHDYEIRKRKTCIANFEGYLGAISYCGKFALIYEGQFGIPYEPKVINLDSGVRVMQFEPSGIGSYVWFYPQPILIFEKSIEYSKLEPAIAEIYCADFSQNQPSIHPLIREKLQ